jgi:outer membrane receptor protein involved in Fe transport
MHKKAKRLLPPLCLLAATVPMLALSAESEATDDYLELEPVVVTGSHIPTIQKEGPSPVTRLTSEDMDARGFTTLDEALNSLTQITGIAQNETMSRLGAFTQNANALELRDLGPGHTLVLVDGHRQAEYPMPYNGQSNFVNLSSIPVAAIDHVELLSSGASAIYGSDAVAGVVNIVLKEKLDEPFSLNLRYGDTSQGGGQSVRTQLVTGFETGRLNTLFAAEYLSRDPVYAFQRSFQDSTFDNPDETGRSSSRSILRYDWGYDSYYDPGPTACDAFPNLTYASRPDLGYNPGDPGYYCGDDQAVSQFTLRNARNRGSLFSRFTYSLDKAELYGAVNLLASADRYDSAFTFFSSDYILPSIIFFDVADDPNGDGGVYTILQRLFEPYEFGGYKARQFRDHEKVMDFSGGIRGNMAGDWTYDLTLAGSHYKYRENAPQLLAQPMLDYFLGTQLMDANGDPLPDPYFGDVPVYDVDWSKVYQPVSRETYNSFLAINRTRAYSDSKTATLVMNGSLLDLPSGPLQSAVVVEAARQKYNITLDPRLLAGDFFAAGGTGGGGERKRYAAGLEFRVPVFDPLTMKLATRYDRYDDITKVKGALTYNAGLEYRPIRQLLLRGGYATSFRAPDMHYVFADPSTFFTSVTDEYLCRRDQPGMTCTISSGMSIEGGRAGNPFLEEETSNTYTYGLVVEPVRNLLITADYYYIKLKDAVQDDSIAQLLETEADCRLGSTMAGVPVDINSLECQSALARVQREAADGSAQSEFLQRVTTGPINASMLKTSGIDTSLAYGLSAGSFGRFDFTANFSTVLSYKFRQFDGDDIENELKSLQYFGWHSRMSGSVKWTYGNFSTTAFVERFGSTPNWAETGRLGSWASTNLSGRYSGLMGGDVYVGFVIDNLFNRKPPRDPTFDTYPYYSDFNYDPIGREYFLEFGTRF